MPRIQRARRTDRQQPPTEPVERLYTLQTGDRIRFSVALLIEALSSTRNQTATCVFDCAQREPDGALVIYLRPDSGWRITAGCETSPFVMCVLPMRPPSVFCAL